MPVRPRAPLRSHIIVYTIFTMEIEFDSRKDEANRAKHECSLADAARLDWDAAVVIQDDRQNYGEERYIITAPIQGRLYVVAITPRAEKMRIISLRRANRRETKRYAKAIIKASTEADSTDSG